MSSVLAAHALNRAKSMMPVHPLSLTKQQSQSIVLDPSVTNSYIHIDTPGNKTPKETGIEGWTERWRDIFLLLFLFRLGVLVIGVPPQFLQLQIALPPLPPAVCPVKSAHDVSLSQLWVKIHRINRFVRETHAWDCLHAVRLVHALVRPILPQAMEKQGTYRYTQDPHERTCTCSHTRACMHICKQTNRYTA